MDLKNYFRLIAEDQERGILAQALKPILRGIGVVYGSGTVLVRRLYEKGVLQKKRLPFPVISVGNLTWGGTGKTPLVEYLARKVLELQKKPLVLTRGYGPDEVIQFKAHLPSVPMGVGRNRYKAAREVLSKERIDVAILDDGFQHWGIIRDIDILTVNAVNPFGNKRLFPRGILREPEDALRRATIVVLTHVNLVGPKELTQLREEIRQIAPSAIITEAYLEPLFFYRARRRNRVSLDQLGNRRVATFSAVGNPRSFQLLLRQVGIKPARNFEYCDHHVFTRKELEEIHEVSRRSGVSEIITTEKDFHRAPDAIADTLDPLILATRLEISAGEEILTDRIFLLLGLVRSRRP